MDFLSAGTKKSGCCGEVLLYMEKKAVTLAARGPHRKELTQILSTVSRFAIETLLIFVGYRHDRFFCPYKSLVSNVMSTQQCRCSYF